MAVGTLTGCGAGKTDSRIVIWTNMSVEVDTLQKYADEWGEKNGYEVEVLHQSPSVQQFAQAVKSASGPDAVVVGIEREYAVQVTELCSYCFFTFCG